MDAERLLMSTVSQTTMARIGTNLQQRNGRGIFGCIFSRFPVAIALPWEHESE